MDPDVRLLLKKNLELSEENNRMLKSMKRSQRFNSIMRILYWAFIIGVGYVSLQAIQPYVTMLTNTYSQIQGVGSGSNSGSPSSFNWKDAAEFLKSF